MAIIGTFGSFTAARMGIYASQSALNITGNNISNINTKGYTRQRLDLVSLHSFGTARYANKMNMDVGYGVLTNGVSQLRDPFIDIRYRDEQSKVGSSETWLDGLNQISHTLDEVGDGDDFGIVERQFNDLGLQLEQLLGAVGTTEYDTTVRSSAKVLCNLLNSYAKALEKVEDTQTKNLKDDVTSVNTILTRIRDLNVEIREAGIHGAKALELRDERNVLIDDLSTYMNIEVSYDMEKLDEFNSVERLNINIAGSGNPPTRLVCGTYATELEMPEEVAMRNPEYNFDNPNAKENAGKDKYVAKVGTDLTTNPPTIVTTDNIDEALMVNNAKTGDDNEGDNRVWMSLKPLVNAKGRVFRNANGEQSKTVELGDNTLYGSLQSRRELATGKGEFASELDVQYKNNATEVRGVPYYRKSLDGLAQKFAQMFNEANQFNFNQVKEAYKLDTAGTSFVGKDGNAVAFTDEDGNPVTVASDYFEKVDQKDPEAVEKAYKLLEQLRQKGALKEEYAFYNGGVLFSSSGDTNDMTGITAKNITIAKGWSTGEVRILNTKSPDILIDPSNPNTESVKHSTLNDNVAHMVSLMSQKLDYFPKETDPGAASDKRYFNGSFQERLADMNVVLAVDKQTTTTLYNSYSVKSLNLENDRQSVCGVDLNDEATNMMMFQKSYSAACQLMTTLDSMLDKLINGTL